MIKMLFKGLLVASNSYYGDAIGLAPIALANHRAKENCSSKNFWREYCDKNPTRISCLDYES